MRVPAPAIITCPEWDARPPSVRPRITGRPALTVFHHTDGHSPEHAGLIDVDRNAAVSYARELQHVHMDVNGWDDSGHNFLVMRSGLIVQGRWGSVTAIEHGRMVVSAHCPGQNDQPGIEHEHLVGEQMTPAQFVSTVALHAWIMDRCGIRPTEVYAHRHFFATACPDVIAGDIPGVRLHAAAVLTKYGRVAPRRLGPWSWARFAAGGRLVP